MASATVAASQLVDSIGSALIDNAHRFTCSEANAIVDFLEATGHNATARSFAIEHADGDDPEDEHYTG